MVYIVFVTLGLVLATAWFLTMKKQLQARANTPPFKGVPLAANAHWLLGHLVELAKDGFRLGQQRLHVDEAGEDGLCSFWFFSKPAVSFLLAKDVKAVLNTSSYREAIFVHKHHNDF